MIYYLLITQPKTINALKPKQFTIDMKIPEKFRLNLESYKVYFDNEKKTHVCEDLKTGEKTNIGVIGTFLQMGILKTIEDDPDGFTNPDERIAYLMDKVISLEKRLTQFYQPSIKRSSRTDSEESISSKRGPEEEPPETTKKRITEEVEKVEVKEIQPEISRPVKREPILKKYPKKEDKDSEINHRVMEKIMEKTIEEEENKQPPKDIKIESEEEIDNWMEI
jgi:hypothetical protein